MRIGRYEQNDPFYMTLRDWQVVDLSTFNDIPMDPDFSIGADDELNVVWIYRPNSQGMWQLRPVHYPCGIKIIRRVVRPAREVTAVRRMGPPLTLKPPLRP